MFSQSKLQVFSRSTNRHSLIANPQSIVNEIRRSKKTQSFDCIIFWYGNNRNYNGTIKQSSLFDNPWGNQSVPWWIHWMDISYTATKIKG
jgi:hypothetical protein